MILSRLKPAVVEDVPVTVRGKKPQTVEDYLIRRDYTGAMTLLEFQYNIGERGEDTDLWLGYCAFHLGDYKRAMERYTAIVKKQECCIDVWVYLACTFFFLGLYKEAEEAALKAPKSLLQNRLLFHLALKFHGELQPIRFHQYPEHVTEDQLSLASMYYMCSCYQEAIDIYQCISLQTRGYLALNVYVALCYYKMEYYDVSQQVLAVYLQRVPESTIALNLKACNLFRLFSGKAAEAELKNLMDISSTSFEYAKGLIQHNLVVFRGGEGALQVLPALIDVIPEARLNLIIYHLKQEDVQGAYALIKDLELHMPQEYILKGVVNLEMGQEIGLRDHLKIAQQLFLSAGLTGKFDSIPRRQCLASYFFLLQQFEDVLHYLKSIRNYFFSDDTFNFNYAQALAAVGDYREAAETFMLIQNEKIKSDYVYLSWLARCYIMNRKAHLAWELYQKMDILAESRGVLQLIANDCYKMGQFYYAAKAFDVLERVDPTPEYWEGKRGACVGVFQLILAGREPRGALKRILPLLRNTESPQVQHIIRIFRKWARDNDVLL